MLFGNQLASCSLVYWQSSRGEKPSHFPHLHQNSPPTPTPGLSPSVHGNTPVRQWGQVNMAFQPVQQTAPNKKKTANPQTIVSRYLLAHGSLVLEEAQNKGWLLLFLLPGTFLSGLCGSLLITPRALVGHLLRVTFPGHRT